LPGWPVGQIVSIKLTAEDPFEKMIWDRTVYQTPVEIVNGNVLFARADQVTLL
jgi:hypothetical protein